MLYRRRKLSFSTLFYYMPFTTILKPHMLYCAALAIKRLWLKQLRGHKRTIKSSRKLSDSTTRWRGNIQKTFSSGRNKTRFMSRLVIHAFIKKIRINNIYFLIIKYYFDFTSRECIFFHLFSGTILELSTETISGPLFITSSYFYDISNETSFHFIDFTFLLKATPNMLFFVITNS